MGVLVDPDGDLMENRLRLILFSSMSTDEIANCHFELLIVKAFRRFTLFYILSCRNYNTCFPYLICCESLKEKWFAFETLSLSKFMQKRSKEDHCKFPVFSLVILNSPYNIPIFLSGGKPKCDVKNSMYNFYCTNFTEVDLKRIGRNYSMIK